MSDQSPQDGEPFQASEDGSDVARAASRPRVVRKARRVAMAFLTALLVYSVIGLLAHQYAYFEWDLTLARRIQSISIPGFEELMLGISFLGGWFAWIMVIGAGLALVQKGLRCEGIVCMLGVGLGGTLNRLLKAVIGRPRPTDLLVHVSRAYNHESFPSGHVVIFIEFFGFLFFLTFVVLKPGRLRGALQSVLVLLIALVGVSRVYLGAHWPSDVLGAYLAGGIWLMLMIAVYQRIKAKTTRDAPTDASSGGVEHGV